MGYTYAETSLAMDCTSYLNGRQSVNTTAESSFIQVSLPVSAPSHMPKKHTLSRPLVCAKDAGIPQFKIRGGFYKAGAGRKQLFLAGHLFKQRTRQKVRNVPAEITMKQISGVSA